MISDVKKIRRLLLLEGQQHNILNAFSPMLNIRENNQISTFNIYEEISYNILGFDYILEYNTEYLNQSPLSILNDTLINKVLYYFFGYNDITIDLDKKIYDACYEYFFQKIISQADVDNNEKNINRGKYQENQNNIELKLKKKNKSEPINNLLKKFDTLKYIPLPQQMYMQLVNQHIASTYHWKQVLYYLNTLQYFYSYNLSLDSLFYHSNSSQQDISQKDLSQQDSSWEEENIPETNFMERKVSEKALLNEISSYKSSNQYFSITLLMYSLLKTKASSKILDNILRAYKKSDLDFSFLNCLLLILVITDNYDLCCNNDLWTNTFASRNEKWQNISELLLASQHLTFNDIYDSDF